MAEPDLAATVLAFARTLRAAGVDASTHRTEAALEALGHVGVLEREDAYWAGRATLCATPDELPRYDRAFAAFFAGERGVPPGPARRERVVRAAALPAGPDAAGDPAQGSADRTATASRVEVLRHRDVAALDAGERAAVVRLLAALDVAAPTRTSSRRRPAPGGEVDPRRSVRESLRRGGEPHLRHRARAQRPRRLVLLVDVSGSMAPYSEALLRFAHAAARRRRGTEVFTVGTRLTRVTREIAGPDPDAALRAVAAAVPDWSGGTRLGELLRAFLDRWGQRGAARGAVVVVASDGWERGDATLLGEQMARLHRLAHRVVWVNPHRGRPGYAPVTAGMAAALPHVDAFVEGHSVAALERAAAALAEGARRA